MDVRAQGAILYVAVALIATGGVATYATTPNTPTAEEAKVSTEYSPYAEISNSKKMLLFISQAERLIFKGDRTFAKMHINEAINTASLLPDSIDAATTDTIHRITLIKLLDGTRESQMMVAQNSNITEPLQFSSEFLPADKKQITSAEVHYISSHWDKAALLASLNKILRAIETGKNNAIIPELNHMHNLLLTNNERAVSHRRAAQDNVTLARALLQADAFSAAKSALAQANNHIKKIADQKDASPKRFEEIAEIRNQMAEVTKVIERKEPSTFKVLDKKLGKWWDALS